MNRWIKRLALFVAGFVVVLGIVAGWAYSRVRGTPEWLKRSTASAEERAAAANRLDQKIFEALSAVREWNDPSASSQPVVTDGKDQRPVAAQRFTHLKVSFTEDELNASFQKWNQLYRWTDRYRNYVQDPSIVLHDGKIILAGNSEELGTVVSLHFDPQLTKDGQLDLELSSILAGRLPVPQGFLQKYKTSARTKLESVLPGFQRKANLEPDGSANSDAMAAAMAKLFLRVLDDQPGEPVLFLPVANKRSVPVRLTGVTIEDKELTLTVKPLNAKERTALIDQLRASPGKATAAIPLGDAIP